MASNNTKDKVTVKGKEKVDKSEKTNDKTTQNVKNTGATGKEATIKLPSVAVQKNVTDSVATLPKIKKKPAAAAGSAAQLDLEFQQ